MLDLYSKVMLTVIAVALSALAIVMIIRYGNVPLPWKITVLMVTLRPIFGYFLGKMFPLAE
jgi:hypothetical protein